MKYDPLKSPDPGEWLELDEQERIALVEEYHRKAGELLPNANIHAIIHVIVENQIAERVDAVCRTLDRLMREGLDRHDGVHAIGSVLMEFLQDMLDDRTKAAEAQERYFKALRVLTKKSWYKMYE